MGKRAIRKLQIRSFLENRDWNALIDWSKTQSSPDRTLVGLLYDPAPLIRWRAIEGLGEMAALRAQTDAEPVRKIIRTLLWNMNDESGGLIWNGGEAIGAILVRLPALIDEYGRILASFIHEEPFERGTHWALTWIAPLRPEVFVDVTDQIAKAQTDPDPHIRAFAFKTLLALRSDAKKPADSIFQDETQIEFYDLHTGQLTTTTVARFARDAWNTRHQP